MGAALMRAQVETGKTALLGRVLDPAGQALAAAEISLLDLQTGQRWRVTSDTEGKFRPLSPNVQQEQNRYGIVVHGQRSINSNISVDGVDFNDSLQGRQRGGGPQESAYFFPQLAVREFQVVRDGASAEVGRTKSGYINVVTKSGSNPLHGAAIHANRNGSMTSQDAFGYDSSSGSQHQFGGSAF
jgi:hypothetical protein